MTATVDGRGGRLDLQVRIGAAMPTVALTLSQNGYPVDLTGTTVAALCVTREATPANVTIVAAVHDAPNGVILLDMAAVEVARFAALSPSNVSSPPKVAGDWTLDATAGGIDVPMIWGEVRVAGGAGPAGEGVS